MTRKSLLFLCLSVALLGCHKDSPARKIIDGLPVLSSPPTVVPAQATQQYLLLKNAMLNPVITNLTRVFNNLPPTGLTSVGGGSYSYTTTERHYGSATFTIQCRDVNNSPVDPFATISATSSVKSVHITESSSNNASTFSEDLTLNLQTVGILIGPYSLNGSSTFNGPSYSIIFTLAPEGVAATISGLINGNATSAPNTGSALSSSSSLSFGTKSDISGILAWDGQTAGIHVSSDGSGYLTTDTERILFQ